MRGVHLLAPPTMAVAVAVRAAGHSVRLHAAVALCAPRCSAPLLVRVRRVRQWPRVTAIGAWRSRRRPSSLGLGAELLLLLAPVVLVVLLLLPARLLGFTRSLAGILGGSCTLSRAGRAPEVKQGHDAALRPCGNHLVRHVDAVQRAAVCGVQRAARGAQRTRANAAAGPTAGTACARPRCRLLPRLHLRLRVEQHHRAVSGATGQPGVLVRQAVHRAVVVPQHARRVPHAQVVRQHQPVSSARVQHAAVHGALHARDMALVQALELAHHRAGGHVVHVHLGARGHQQVRPARSHAPHPVIVHPHPAAGPALPLGPLPHAHGVVPAASEQQVLRHAHGGHRPLVLAQHQAGRTRHVKQRLVAVAADACRARRPHAHQGVGGARHQRARVQRQRAHDAAMRPRHRQHAAAVAIQGPQPHRLIQRTGCQEVIAW
mmetsp:Transcript_27565/g.70220  ORF Transcript_27565/g.70220 Transcript_27565/m.70220 type:complete len:432 (-) Transcript_27565:387-1682(-)